MKTIANITFALMIMFQAINVHAETVKGIVKDQQSGVTLADVEVTLKNTTVKTTTGSNGEYTIEAGDLKGTLVFYHRFYVQQEIKIGGRKEINVGLMIPLPKPETVEVIKHLETRDAQLAPPSMHMDLSAPVSLSQISVKERKWSYRKTSGSTTMVFSDELEGSHNTEEYDVINETGFRTPQVEPLSTFSIDVDAASYANIRRIINSGHIPEKDAVRIEEMVNYFDYDYPQPKGKDPFSINTEISKAPWNPKHQLVHIGLQGKDIDYNDLKPCNLVFLIDVSGSMSASNKLPLLKSSLMMLVNQLNHNDRVAIVVYAGAAGLVLESTPASEKEKIIASLDMLSAGGSTAGGEGIKLAYKVAKENIIKNGNNRVILATDGDFNVGPSSTSDMVRLIEEKRKDGIFLTITGFGMGNYKDGRMEQISNAGNGNYYYIDNIKEAEKIFVTEMRATLFTIAKDVKIQVEFNPKYVQAYRLIGYENRALDAEDFNDDKKDAGELGAGHTVTALYEIIPVGVESSFIKKVDALKYQAEKNKQEKHVLNNSTELLTVKFRYKDPDGSESKLIEHPLPFREIDIRETSDNFRFSAAVAEFGMILRDSEFKGDSNYDDVIELANSAMGQDAHGYRKEFLEMVRSGKLIANK